jgi:hypothetical protein
MFYVTDIGAIHDCANFAGEGSREHRFGNAYNKRLLAKTVLDQFRERNKGEVFSPRALLCLLFIHQLAVYV